VTSIEKDGTLAGPDRHLLEKISHVPRAYIIAAGGIGNLEDLIMLRQIGISGVVIGKALYEGRFNFVNPITQQTYPIFRRIHELLGDERESQSNNRNKPAKH
jgi:phosphoribosylformimino-5-aminoimidazole carboxamide ribonucleotide (ProFAR) isomerase